MSSYVSSVVPAPSAVTDTSGILLKDVPCDVTVYVSAAVIMNGLGTALNALADSIANSNVIGIVVSKSSSTLCDIRVTGVTNDVFAGLDVSKEYYLSNTTPGGITTTPPITSGHIRLKLGQPFSGLSLLVAKGERVVKA